MEKISLNFGWTFKTNKGLEEALVNIPHPGVEIPITHFNPSDVEVISTYTKELEFNVEDLNKHLELLFEGAAHQTRVFLNEELIYVNKGGYIPFSVVIYPKLGKNILKIEVDSSENKNIPPFGGIVDYLGYGGLYREVYLIKKPKKHIKNIKVIYQDILKNDIVSFIIEVSNKGFCALSIFNMKDEEIIKKEFDLKDTINTVSVQIKDKFLWDLDNPYLYKVSVQFEGALYEERFGLREAIFKKEGFYLNGKHLKLIGLNRHQSYPYVGYAMPKGAQEEDADLLKSLGVNIARTSHYPQSKHFINRCDEIGLLVFEEIPGWQHIGDAAWQELSIENVRKMILRDFNNPSIILWGVRINESSDHHEFYAKTNSLARELDSFRQTGGVRNSEKSEFLEDVYTYNDFTHEGNNKGLSKKKHITSRKNPYLVTEHNGHMFPTKASDPEIKRINQALRHLNVINAAKDKKSGISGAIGWCFSDYQTHPEFGSGDLICHHGVLDIYRNPKIAAYAYMAEGSNEDVLFVSSGMHIGEYPKSDLNKVFVFTNLEYIKLYKNGEYIKTFYKTHKTYKHLTHPPIVVDDFIGDLIHKNEGFTIKDSKRAKGIIRAVQKYGPKLPIKHKLTILYILKKYKLTMNEGISLFYKYISNWGSKQSDYRFDGYRGNELIKSVTKSIYKTYDFLLTPTRTVLKIGNTYDATRVVFKMVDQNNEVASYAYYPIEIEVDNLELIGPRVQTLNNGMIAFWVKTAKPGSGIIRVKVLDKEYIQEVVVKKI